MSGARQLDLLSMGDAAVPGAVGAVERIDLGGGAWIDHAAAWLPGPDQWLSRWTAGFPWGDHERPMYDRIVRVPRRTVHFGDDPSPDLVDLAVVLGTHYRRPLDRIGANWYRDGDDSVAWHADRVPRPGDSITAIVSVGHRRTFLLRPRRGGGRSQRWALGEGDLFVLGGTIQAGWQHCVPKVAHAAERVCVMFRDRGVDDPGSDR